MLFMLLRVIHQSSIFSLQGFSGFETSTLSQIKQVWFLILYFRDIKKRSIVVVFKLQIKMVSEDWSPD